MYSAAYGSVLDASVVRLVYSYVFEVRQLLGLSTGGPKTANMCREGVSCHVMSCGLGGRPAMSWETPHHDPNHDRNQGPNQDPNQDLRIASFHFL